MNRKRIVAGNWKMNKTLPEVESFLQAVDIDTNDQVEAIIAAPFPFINVMASRVKGINVAAQNCASFENGAYTGEVSVDMIKSCGATHVIIGHSERRQYFAEDDDTINAKIKLSLSRGLVPILCCGESLEQRKNGQEKAVVESQLKNGLVGLDEELLSSMIIAYEPVWAIGTGETATADQAESMHAFIRSLLPSSVGDDICILYGGSVKPGNFQELLEMENIDGGLIGGASLEAASFNALYEIAVG